MNEWYYPLIKSNTKSIYFGKLASPSNFEKYVIVCCVDLIPLSVHSITYQTPILVYAVFVAVADKGQRVFTPCRGMAVYT